MKKLCMLVIVIMALSMVNAQNSDLRVTLTLAKSQDTLQVIDSLDDESPKEFDRNDYVSDHFNNFGDGTLVDHGGKRLRKVKFLQINIIKKTLLYLNPSKDPEDHRDNRGNKQIEFIYLDEVDQKVKSYLLRPTGYVLEDRKIRFFDNKLFILQFNNPRLWEQIQKNY